jgi:ribosomal-protein-alanine N-acetyltransferase
MLLSSLELRSDRLVLREFREDDRFAVHEYASDLEVVRYMPFGPNSEEQTSAFIRRSLASREDDPRRSFELAVTLADTGRLIGGCGIRASCPEHRSGDMGYCLRRDVWGRGYATEAGRLLLDFGFDTLGLHRIWATCDVDNFPSARVLEKLGMKREGQMREDSWVRGRWRSSCLYAVLESERVP